MIEDKIKQIAINEVDNPTFELTKQYLSVHKLIYSNGLPVIEYIEFDKDDQSYKIYFPIENESYYLTVSVEVKPETELSWVHIEAGNRVYLVVASDKVELDTLLEVSQLNPSETWKKGENINKKRIHEDSGFVFEPNPVKAGQLEIKIENLLNYLEDVKENIINISKLADLQINIAYYGYKDEMWGWHVDSKTIKRLAELNLSVDLDLYAGGPDLS